MVNNMKRVYEYCQQENLSPKIKYWYDDNGDDGFEIYIEW